ncbi:hypothetical protein FSP39_002420 [Pinctada imbricata]|uniref:Uncharacterized protein n=1 Tax=Pinctada imbricata TaxID=66713 RepID=A0AA89C8V1_PINIB|nr:hypothetical protein FSP39_002420 [Pinctada imbricata]
MCRECDRGIHGNPEFSSHLVLDASKRRTAVSLIGRGDSTPNLKGQAEVNESEVGGQGDDNQSTNGEDIVDGIFMKKPDVVDFRPPPTPSAAELKLKRKKVLKLKRRHTDGSQSGNDFNSEDSDDTEPNIVRRKSDDLHSGSPSQRLIRRHSKSVISDECFTIRFPEIGDNDMEIVAAIRGVSLRAALVPLIERRGLDISRINVFVEASNTPLPLECESFLLGGNTLHIKEKDSELGFSKNNSRPNSGGKNSANKNSKGSGMGRRESFFGRAPSSLEVPTVKQRRNSLSIPFFTNAPKSGDGSRPLDDNQPVGSLRSRRGINLSIDDTTPIPAVLASISPQGTLTGYTEGRRVKDRSKLTNLFSPMGSKRSLNNNYSTISKLLIGNLVPAAPRNELPPLENKDSRRGSRDSIRQTDELLLEYCKSEANKTVRK